MKLELAEEAPRLKLLRLQFIEREDGVILKRGRTQLKIGGDGAADAIRMVLTTAAERDVSRDELSALFPAPLRPAIDELVRLLESKRFLIPVNGDTDEDVPESNLDVFYWHFNQKASQVQERFGEIVISVLGVNCISRQLVMSLRAAGADNVAVVNYPPLCNLRLYDDEGNLAEAQWPAPLESPVEYREWRSELDHQPPTLVIATSDFGGQELLRTWNQFCVARGIPFLPIVLQDLIGYIGPLVVPGETACLECLRARQNSHMSDPAVQRAAEARAFESQAVNGFHPSMASILGDLAALELTKLYGGLAGAQIAGRLIEVNLMSPQLTTRKVLKIPRCRVCTPLHARSPVSTDRDQYMPGNEVVS